MIEKLRDGGFRGHARDGAAVQHLLDSIEERVIGALGKGDVQGASVRIGMGRHRERGIENGERQERAPGRVRMLAFKRKDGAAPLLGKCGSELVLRDGSNAKKEVADTAGTRCTLKAKSIAELRVGDGGLLNQEQAERKTMRFRFLFEKGREQIANAIFEVRAKAGRLTKPM
jgi:hypothetical protein